MTYSYHDMPLQLNTPNGKVQNYYTASGMKIKSVLLPNNMTLSDGPTITNYFDNIEYENSEVKAVYFDEGRAVTSKEGDYIEYFIKDHLGNTRVRISDKDQNNKVHYNVNDPANDEVMSSHHYYPFGMEWDKPSFDINGNSLASAGKDAEYTYNGKEFQEDLGIDLHYYGFRVYDPAIGRFTSVDPIAERFAFVSGFNYAENEPIANIDLHGLQAVSIHADVRASAYATGSFAGGIVFDFKGNVGLYGTAGLGLGAIGGYSASGGVSYSGGAKDIYALRGWGASAVFSGFFDVGVSGSWDVALGQDENNDISINAYGGTATFGVGLEAGVAAEGTYTWITGTTWEEIGELVFGSSGTEREQYESGLTEAINFVQNTLSTVDKELRSLEGCNLTGCSQYNELSSKSEGLNSTLNSLSKLQEKLK